MKSIIKILLIVLIPGLSFSTNPISPEAFETYLIDNKNETKVQIKDLKPWENYSGKK